MKQMQQVQSRTQIDAEVESTSCQISVPSSSSAENFGGPRETLESQQTAQCQGDVVDVKPCIQATSPIIKQELTSPVQIQTAQNASPAGQVMSPRMTAKPLQNTQNKLLSPDNSSTSPRQGVKRTSSSSPVCRQVNRTDL